ncbi:hypothetical protein HCH_03034 [Hahella chejuensis KCTC 2396]|uniref:Uncharacterized protein n=1 Tax=Hahella chejuensis (strain KCTC 2396) TaxID=349521 RepID=Q2SHS4_HAHCH|nr:hypothetical protein HCH_03034 [Hahella chejuensis KCTC 2396]
MKRFHSSISSLAIGVNNIRQLFLDYSDNGYLLDSER